MPLKQKLYIIAECHESGSYFIKVYVKSANNPSERLAPHSTETAFTEYGKIKNFEIIVQRTAQKSESNSLSSVRVNLDTQNAHIFLYGFIRTSRTSPWVTDEFINSKVDLGRLGIKGFVSDTSVHESKHLDIQFNCDASTALFSMQIAEDYYEYTCSIAVAAYVKSRDSKGFFSLFDPTRAGAVYQISYTEARTHTILHHNHFTNVHLDPFEKKLFQFNFHGSKHTSVESINFELQAMFGNATVVASQITRNPCQALPDAPNELLTRQLATNTHTTIIFGKGGADLKSLTGTYYLCATALDQVSSIGINVKLGKVKNSKRARAVQDNLQMIPPNQNIMGQISSPNEQLMFGFRANLDPKQEEFIRFHVLPIKGATRYRIAVSNNEKKPTANQDFWNVISETLTISSSDSMYQPNALYIVSISAIPESNQADQVHRFTVSYNYGNKHTLLRPGLPFTATMQNDTSQQFSYRVEFPRTSTNLTFLKTQVDGRCSLHISFSQENQYPTALNRHISLNHLTHGFYLNSSDIDKYCAGQAPGQQVSLCNIYITAVPELNNSKVLLQYATNEDYFIVHQSHFVTLPAFVKGPEQRLKFLYEIPQEKNSRVEVECSNGFRQYRTFLSFKKESQSYTFPSESSNDREFSSQYTQEFTKEDYGSNNIMLITVATTNDNNWFKSYYPNQELSFTSAGKLLISDSVKTLSKGVRVKGECRENNWSHFSLYHQSLDNIVVNFESFAGNAFVFISKPNPVLSRGKKVKAGFENYLARSFSQNDADLMVTKDMMPPGEPVQGEYDVSVYCSGPGRYGLLYNSENNKFLQVYMNDPFSVKAVGMVNQYVEFTNYGPQLDIHVTFKSSKAKVRLYYLAVDPPSGKELPSDQMLPTPEMYHFNYHSEQKGGIGSLLISKESEVYCQACRHIILIRTDIDDTVDFVIRKHMPWVKTLLEDGKEIIGALNKEEAEDYFLFAQPLSVNTGLELQVVEGNISIEYSKDPAFPAGNTSRIYQWQPDEYFTITFPSTPETTSGSLFRLGKRFLRIRGYSDINKYILTYSETNKVLPLKPNSKPRSTLSPGFKKFYYIESTDNEDFEVTFTLNKVYATDQFDLSAFNDNINRIVRVWSVKTMAKVLKREMSTKIVNVRKDLYSNQLTVRFTAPEGFVAIEIYNRLSNPISYKIELSRYGSKQLDRAHNTVGLLDEKSPNITYQIHTDTSNLKALFDINQCMQPLKVSYRFVPDWMVRDNLTTSVQPVTLFDRYISQREVPLEEKGTLYVTFVRPEVKNDTLDTGISSKAESAAEFPTIFNFRFNLKSPDKKQSQVTRENFSFSNYAGESQLVVLDGSVVIKKLAIQDEERILKDFSVHVNYTLYLSTNPKLLAYMKTCDGFAFDQASQFFGDGEHYSFSETELLTYDKYVEQQEAERTRRAKNLPANPFEGLVRIRPTVFSFNTVYHSTIIAKVLVFSRSVSTSDCRTCPRSRKAPSSRCPMASSSSAAAPSATSQSLSTSSSLSSSRSSLSSWSSSTAW